MEIYPLKSTLIRPNTNLLEPIARAISRGGLRPKNGDVIVVSSKVVALSEGSLAHRSEIMVEDRAKRLARNYRMDGKFTQIVLDQADRVLHGVNGAILTLKDGDAVANSGADQKNGPDDKIVLWPRNPDQSARSLRRQLEARYHKRLGLIVADSRVTPLRLGTVGLALACSGFDPIIDVRGKPDLYGRQVRITRLAVADGLADAAHVVMGESGQAIPFALVRDSPVVVDRKDRPRRRMLISMKECLYMSNIKLSKS